MFYKASITSTEVFIEASCFDEATEKFEQLLNADKLTKEKYGYVEEIYIEDAETIEIPADTEVYKGEE